MAFPTSTSSNLALFLKLAFISTAALSVALILKLTVSAVTYFAVTELPVMYSSVLSWLQPPYLYLVINGIIISIVASSKLHLQNIDEPFKHPPATTAVSSGYEDLSVVAAVGKVSEGCDDEVVVSSKLVQPPPPRRSDSMELLFQEEEKEKEKPLVSARFVHKKSVKPNPEGGKATVLGVSKSKKQDTLENTWKMITDGHPMPLTRHLKKSDTCDSHLPRDDATSPDPPAPAKMSKSETFSNNKSKLSQSRQGSGKLRKEPSLSQDELNRRVEEFIKKFNEEMRLQRQESLNQYQEMLTRGGY